ncbi:neprilysin-2-like [Macrosteles quadrilineatus]|uniref:neprilysin-2-like n=1 Tax=Macrosteles quadrilineatus TaxID=74068 RepID=UPI0023E1F44E|nr:neprilysin-2-like [Macrosteles quadrilineatus]
MDPSVDPCQDFYKFACGGFINKTTIPPDREMWTSTSDLEMKILRRIQAEFNSTSALKGKPRCYQLANTFYRACMDIEAVEDQDLDDMKVRLEQLGGWPVMDDHGVWDPDNFHWTNMTVWLAQRGWCWDMVVDVAVALVANDTSRYQLELSQPVLGIPREYLVQGLEDDVVLAYYEMMVEVAVQFGVPFHYAKEDMSDVLMLEMELAKISVPQEEMRDHFQLYNPFTLKQMDARFPYANWSMLIPACLKRYVTITPNEVVNVAVPSFFEHLGELLERVDKRIVANYMLWHIVYESMPYLTTRVSRLRLVLMTALTGATKLKPRWEFCVNNLIDRFEHVVGAAYVKKYVSRDMKPAVTRMVGVIHQQFQKLITEVPWMDERTRRRAKKKADSIFYHIGYPDELLDDRVLEEYYEKVDVSADLLSSVLSLQDWESHKALSLLRSEVNKTRWDAHCEVTEVNAFYLDDHNAVEIPAGILQYMFYSPDRPDSLNYGGLGAVMAHELIHSVDDEGKQYDDRGNLNQWWDEETDRQFNLRAADIVSEYSNCTVKEVNMTLKGVNVQGEMIADHGALKLAYNAYLSSRSGNTGDERLATLEQFSSDQLFWLAAATSWCSVERVESVKASVMVDVHPPASVRINGPLRHSETFSKDWQCASHTYMNSPYKYNVW